VISNSTLASAYNCSSGDATCPYVFTIAGDLITNLVSGDNVLAVEAHNYKTNSSDVTFGSAALYGAAVIQTRAARDQPGADKHHRGMRRRCHLCRGGPKHAPLSYQWLLNESILSGANQGVFDCQQRRLRTEWEPLQVIVSNVSGSVVTTQALLKIIDITPPLIACPANIVASTDPGQCARSNVTYRPRRLTTVRGRQSPACRRLVRLSRRA